ncbi:type II toxin-antitoxin system VapC family toxin [uncultured Thiothrix sp.]|uniref:type II toxin-antitoxin system VapC family toxin n=1 Tax=uncultured Thiothrix sp. TaxID=223185 RepID=UPI00260BD3DB|nr:type II toxin-antitoxin system VapC family toxin [uncultured Thiothrix sp.]
MSKVVLDTSAILAYLFDETGAEQVEPILEANLGVISSVNYAELASKLVDKGMPLEAVISAIENLELTFAAQDQQQAQVNAELRPLSKAFGLSLGDRACLALGLVQNLPVMTADRVWKDVPSKVVVRVIR